MRELLIATTNKGKLSEMLSVLEGVPFTILTLEDPQVRLVGGDVEETGVTFEENAILKAKTYGTRTGKLTIAEDTGLEVDALGGAPGVRSARYSEGNDADRNNKLLRELQGVPERERGAQFRTVAALYDPVTGIFHTSEGLCRGSIIGEGRGDNSFGYSPLFLVTEGKTFAELDARTRNALSHRGQAIGKIRDILLAQFV